MPRRRHGFTRQGPGEDRPGPTPTPPDQQDDRSGPRRPADDDWDGLWIDLGGEG